ncbi:ATP-dependent endonuclease [Neobacillus niacini]|uniref:ATP-dependent nuclease n=1 Tax=Neobacillus niacini TaxID=86668 RepID=UPI0021CB46CA|nr:AAA family ATPase [Neobacillus niacini]MCM3763920.1 AAA family ATPase [Neobacillus niacini]
MKTEDQIDQLDTEDEIEIDYEYDDNDDINITLRLKEINLHNFRCFEHLNFKLDESFTTLIGSNSAGKSTVLQAIIKVLSTNPRERIIEKSDFFNPDNAEIKNEMICKIELLFEILEEKSLINEYLDEYIPKFSYQDKDGNVFIKVQLHAMYYLGSVISTVKYLDEQGNVIYVDIKGNLIELSEFQEFNVDRDGTNLRKMVEFFYVPALRNSIKEFQPDSNTLLKKIFKFSNKVPEEENHIKTITTKLNKEILNTKFGGGIQAEIDEKWGKLNPDPIIRMANLKFTGNDYDSILKQVDISFSKNKDNNGIFISQIGDGLQSLFYIALVQVLLDLNRKDKKNSGLTILALEEPENHIAPNIVGNLVKGLRKLCTEANLQVLVSTHSPSLLKRISPESIRLFRRRKNTVHMISSWLGEVEDYKFLKGAVQRYPELYYSNLVILVEGESEEVILPTILEEFGLEIDAVGIAVVPLGGAHVNHMWRLLNDLNIPFLSLLDLDRERTGGGWKKIYDIIEKISTYNSRIKDERDITYYFSNDNRSVTRKKPENMDEWLVEEINLMEKWVQFLESYDVFFSSPLDLDFMMLNAFKNEYKETAENSPRSNETQSSKVTLGLKDDEEVKSYNHIELLLFPWYVYLFLRNVGKPRRHRLALEKIKERMNWKNEIPGPLKRLIKEVENKMKSF